MQRSIAHTTTVPAVRFVRIAQGTGTQTYPAVARELIDAWRDVRRYWNDAERHENALAVAARHGEYPWLVTRYREIARRGDAIATERMAFAQRAAERAKVNGARENKQASKHDQSMRRILWAMMIMLGIVLTHAAMGAH